MINASAGCTITMTRRSSHYVNINRITIKENISVAQNKITDNETAEKGRKDALNRRY